jgi:hypothetical protein
MTGHVDIIARAERAIQNARDFTDDKKPSLQITMELLAAVKASEEQQLRITGPNSDGEYWLHLKGFGRSGGINLGTTHGRIVQSLLDAFSEATAIRAAKAAP